MKQRLKSNTWILLITVLSFSSCAQKPVFTGSCDAPSHGAWTDLLQANVDSAGWVNYQGFIKDSVALNSYLKLLAACPPNANWSENQKLAYWINVYNAFTVKLIIDYYPVASIRDIKKGIPFINSVWDLEFFEIGGVKMDLTSVEHDILREEFVEPRIHFAIVCASKSCPQLLNEAFVAEKIEEQLQQQAIRFINDASKNEIEMRNIRLSSIFKWFKKDFTKKGTLQQFVKKYSEKDFDVSAKVKYLDYDWSLNEK